MARKPRREHEPPIPKATPEVARLGHRRSTAEMREVSLPTGVPAYVRQAREALGWSQTELARQSGVGRSYINLLEAGKILKPSAFHLNALAQALGVPPEYLTSGRTDTERVALYLDPEEAASADRIRKRYGLEGFTLAERLLASIFAERAQQSAAEPAAQRDVANDAGRHARKPNVKGMESGHNVG